MSGLSVGTKLTALGAGATVGVGMKALTNDVKEPGSNFAWAAGTAALSAGAFLLMKHGLDGGVANAATFAATGMGLGAALGHAGSGVLQLTQQG